MSSYPVAYKLLSDEAKIIDLSSFSLLSDDQITELKQRIDKSQKVCSVEHNGRITERLHRNGRSGDSLLTQ